MFFFFFFYKEINIAKRLTDKNGRKTIRVCLFGGEIKWMKNFEEKMRRKTFLEWVWLGGKKGK